MTPTLAVLGGYGAVGAVAARELAAAHPRARLRIGGRRLDEAAGCAARLGDRAEPHAVDLTDPASLAAFCTGSTVVVNCAGPSYRVLDTVAKAAFAAGADYVDAGGDEPVHRALSERDPAGHGRAAVLTAGMMPGLTGLLPRWLAAQGVEEPHRLLGYVGTMDRLTPAGAGDYLLSLGGAYGEAQSAWRGGARVLRVLQPLNDTELPFFPGTVSAYPYLSYEVERLARDLGLATVDWYNVFDGGSRMLKTLGRLQGAMTGQSALEPAARDLIEAAGLDLFGRDPYQLFVLELTGRSAGRDAVRALVLRGTDTYELTGAVVAVAAGALLSGQVPHGVHYAAEVLDPGPVVERLRALAAVTSLDLFDRPLDEVSAPEEGEL
ncbi:epimerase [Streptomyces capoamus]|uniref:Epimerase n=1 Tax=Streptomyces capoamus TaxID=68183 RepID=A0A919KAV1_9ACTN|nr:saccharopine dehydrogenase NADP-binding domain-containing protein [Streptomyces capoamus]GGW20691.1 epimerase [Streptomyces libani subsp. rufus]GHG57724.1 epimerase [Streptomyces capoamus]